MIEMEASPSIEEESESSRVLEWDEEENDRLARSKKLYLSKEKSKFFKYVIRLGISNVYRPEIYLILACQNKMVEDLRRFWPDVLSQSSTPKYENIVGLFGYPNYELFTPQSHLDDFLTIVKNQNHEIEFSPMIPCVASILQLFYDDFLTYIMLQSMINEENEKYFVMNKKNFTAMLSTIEMIIKLNKKELHEHSKSIKLDFAVVSLFIVPILFSKKVKKNIVLTIFDSFMNEGRSVLIRYVIGFILKLESDLLQSSTPTEFMTKLFEYIISIHRPSELQQIVSLAFGTDFMKKNKIFPIEKTERMNEHILNKHLKNQQLPNFDDFYRFYANTTNNTYFGRKSNRIRIDRMLYSKVNGGQLITSSQFWEIKKHLHSCFTHLNAYPIFNLSKDGSSFVTLLRRAKSVSSCMLLIKASSGIIGAVLANALQPVYRKNSCGSTLTTVFELNNLKTYHYSRKNEYLLYVTRDSVTIGNGDTGSAIFFEDGFETVVSDPCETFDSPCLLGSQREKIENVELYKLAP